MRKVLYGFLFLALSLRAQTTQFDKRVYKVNGSPVTGNPTSVSNNTLLDWVITYQYNPSPAPPAQTEIRDILSGALQYVPGSLHVPPSWTPQWFGTSWVLAEPANAGGVGALVSPTPFGAGQTVLIPPPPSGTISTVGSGGDGYRAIPARDGNVYVVNHHRATNYLDCYNVATGVRCTGYPYHVPTTANALFNQTGRENGTPGKPYELLDDTTNRLYFPVEKINSTPPHDLGILCADLTNKKSCGFISLATYAGTSTPSSFTPADYNAFQGVSAAGNEIYMQMPNGKLGCVDITTSAPCASLPYSNIATGASEYGSSTIAAGPRLYSLRRASPAYIIECFDSSTHAPCVNWPKTPDPNGQMGILYPLLDNLGNGTITGICANTTTSTAPLKCYDLAGNTVSPPANYQTWVQTYSGGWFQSAGYGQAGWYKSRVFNAQQTTQFTPDIIGCYDFTTTSACNGFTLVSGPDRHYATIADRQRPGCMWFYGDDGRLGSFSAIDGKSCGSHLVVAPTITPADSYCATDGDVSGWDKLYLNGITIGSGITATLSIFDGNHPGNLALNASGAPYAQNAAVTAFPFNLANIGYGTGAGAYTSLQFVLSFSGITNSTAWTQNPPPSLEITWKGAPPEFCFQTKVVGCDYPTITNQATAVTKPFGGTAINDTAPNPPFSATHTTAGECPTTLTITKSIPGVPSGFAGTFTFYVTCATSGGNVQQQVSITWPNTSVTLANLPAGAQCSASESPLLPALPSGYSWSPPVVVTPAGGVVVLNASGHNQISFANNVKRCPDVGSVKITKIVQGAPSGFSGTFTFNVVCWAGSSVITQQAQFHYPGQTAVTIGGIPTGASCTVTETGAMPALPAGWIWDSVTYSPPTGQVSLVETCCPEVRVTNHAKYCCPDLDKKTYSKE
jgi:hypothetical protein